LGEEKSHIPYFKTKPQDKRGFIQRGLEDENAQRHGLVETRLIARTPPPRGGFLFGRYPFQEPGVRGPPSKKPPPVGGHLSNENFGGLGTPC